MTENFEAAELQAQLDECQRIIAAQAETIAAAHKNNAILQSLNEMMTLRAKRAEEGLVQFKADVLAREARALVASAAKCDGNHGGPRCTDPECLNDDRQPGRISKEDRLELVGALGLVRGHRYTGCADALQRVLDADAAAPAATQPVHTLGGSKEEYTRVFNMGRDSAQPAVSAEPAQLARWTGDIRISAFGVPFIVPIDDVQAEEMLSLGRGAHVYISPVAAEPSVPAGFVALPVELAHRVNDALGRFVSDESWDQADMDTSDDLSAATSVPTPPADGQAQQVKP